MAFKFLIFFILLISNNIFANELSIKDSIAIVCRNEFKKIKSAELLDLVEARERDGLSYLKSNDSHWKSVFFNSLKKFNLSNVNENTGREFLISGEKWLHSKIKINYKEKLDESQSLENIKRVFNPRIFPSSPLCSFEIVGRINLEKKEIIISKDIFNHMNSIHQAATIMHLYKIDAATSFENLFQLKNDKKIRKLVGSIYSDELLKENSILSPDVGSAIVCNFYNDQKTLYKKIILDDQDLYVINSEIQIKISIKKIQMTEFSIEDILNNKFIFQKISNGLNDNSAVKHNSLNFNNGESYHFYCDFIIH